MKLSDLPLKSHGRVSATETEAYLSVAAERHRLLRTHDWNEDILQRVMEGRHRRRRRRG